MKKLDLAGQRFGMLYVLERASDIESANGSRKVAWLCKCDCGNTKIVRQASRRRIIAYNQPHSQQLYKIGKS